MRPRPVDIRELWPREDRNFTPWLAENIDLLGEAIGIELRVEGVEHLVPATMRSLDILADSNDRRVAIENQYGQADHDHLTRGLAYAVMLDASALVVVAERHVGEFRAVARYLNDAAEVFGERGIRVYLVELAVDGVGDFYVPRFTVVEEPNPWVTADGAGSSATLKSVDAFLTKIADEATRAVFGEAVAEWEGRGRRIVLTVHAVALHLTNPAKGPNATTAIFTLYDYGHCTVNRGYLLESGAFPSEDDQSELDGALDEFLPTNARARAPYFTAVPQLSASGAAAFGDWLELRLVDPGRS